MFPQDQCPSPQHTTPTLPLPGKKAGRVKKNKQGVRAEAGIYPEHIVDQYISIKCHMTNQRLTQYLFQPLIPCFSKLQRLKFKYKIPKLSCSRGWQWDKVLTNKMQAKVPRENSSRIKRKSLEKFVTLTFPLLNAWDWGITSGGAAAVLRPWGGLC